MLTSRKPAFMLVNCLKYTGSGDSFVQHQKRKYFAFYYPKPRLAQRCFLILHRVTSKVLFAGRFAKIYWLELIGSLRWPIIERAKKVERNCILLLWFTDCFEDRYISDKMFSKLKLAYWSQICGTLWHFRWSI